MAECLLNNDLREATPELTIHWLTYLLVFIQLALPCTLIILNLNVGVLNLSACRESCDTATCWGQATLLVLESFFYKYSPYGICSKTIFNFLYNVIKRKQMNKDILILAFAKAYWKCRGTKKRAIFRGPAGAILMFADAQKNSAPQCKRP